jgi:ankyrin repeat protein
VFKANVFARNVAHLSPLLVACKFGQTATIHLLVELGADLNDKVCSL